MSDSKQLTIEGLASRLERVERLNSGLRKIVAGLAAFVAVFIIISQFNVWPMTSRNVVAESFGLRNSEGKIVALFSVAPDGTGSLGLWDTQKTLRLSIGLLRGSPYVTLTDAQRNVRAIFGLDGKGSPSLEFYDSDGGRRWVAPAGVDKEVQK
jgi:hypothetical protein